MVYDPGDRVVLDQVFRTQSGGVANPGTVRFTLFPPGQGGTVLTYGTPDVWGTITLVASGTYRVSFVPTTGGYYAWTWSGTATVDQAESGRLFVRYAPA